MDREAKLTNQISGVIIELMRRNCMIRIVSYAGYILTINVGKAKRHFKYSFEAVQNNQIIIEEISTERVVFTKN